MPFRFRKIFSLGKGFRLNVSKGGISTSFGKRGATLNLGKSGARTTFGIPGSGLSFTSSTGSAKTGSTSMLAFVISGIVVCIVSVCCLGLIFMPDGTDQPTVTPEANLSLKTIVVMSAEAAQIQTMSAASPVPTATLVPLQTIPPSATLITVEVPQQINSPLPVFETNTPFVFSTNQPSPSGSDVCACTGDLLNCSDFSTHAQAQACFDYCVSQGVGDIHKLDQNNDGLACEGLP